MSWVTEAKKRAATEAVKHVKQGMVLGLGSGSTASHAVNLIGYKIANKELSEIKGVPTSYQIAQEALKNGIHLTSIEEHGKLDLGIDGADQIDKGLNAIKGGGAALFKEKIVAASCKKYVIIADERKYVQFLGENQPLPLEVHPFAISSVKEAVEKLGGNVNLREGSGKLGPVVTDNGNFVYDADFGRIQDPLSLDLKLHSIPGLIETGLFLSYVDFAYIGTRKSVKKIQKNS